jgi:hypothetical protein
VEGVFCALAETTERAGLGLLDTERGQLRISYAGDVGAETASRYHLVDLDAPVPMADVIRVNQPMIVPRYRRARPALRQGCR